MERLLAAAPDVSVLIADDNSPDGTGEVADRLAAEDTRRRITVMHRAGKNGLGAAVKCPQRWPNPEVSEPLVGIAACGRRAVSSVSASQLVLGPCCSAFSARSSAPSSAVARWA